MPEVLAVVCWTVLQTGAMVCSSPMTIGEALEVARSPYDGTQTTRPWFYEEGTPEFAEGLKQAQARE